MKKDLIGLKFGRLTVLKFDKIFNKAYFWKCICDCGNKGSYRSAQLKNGHTKSCGCLHKEWVRENKTVHGMRHTKIYSCWCEMKARCLNPNHKHYKYYGARGIKVCKRWMKFENFYIDMGKVPLGMSLDRIDNSKSYCKNNCRWATSIEQANNKRNNILLTYKGLTLTLPEWARKLNFNYYQLKNRYDRKWPTIKLLETKV